MNFFASVNKKTGRNWQLVGYRSTRLDREHDIIDRDEYLNQHIWTGVNGVNSSRPREDFLGWNISDHVISAHVLIGSICMVQVISVEWRASLGLTVTGEKQKIKTFEPLEFVNFASISNETEVSLDQ